MDIQPYLDDLEKRINPADESRLLGEWRAFADLQWTAPVFAPRRSPVRAGIEWPKVLINDALDDIDTMIYTQLRLCSEMLEDGSGELLCLRGNYGTGIIPSMFGAEVFIMPREHDILPGSKPLPDGKDGVAKILSSRDVDFSRGFAGSVFAVGERFLQLTENRPNIRAHVHCYDPDLQGPLPLAETLWGSDIYLDLYDDEDMVREALDFFADVYIQFLDKWKKLLPDTDADHSVEWGMLHRGGTIIRNDAAMNISGDLYAKFAMPADQKIITRFGGGVHFCGRGDHYIEHLSNLEGLSAINLSQPECNDMETIYKNTVDKDIIIIGLRSDEVQRALSTGRELRGRVHSGASMAAWVEKERR